MSNHSSADPVKHKSPFAIGLGIFTIASPIVVVSMFVYLALGNQNNTITGNMEHEYLTNYIGAFVMDWLLLIGIYLVHSMRNSRLDKASKDKWRMSFCWFAYFAMIAYWYQYIWKPSEK